MTQTHHVGDRVIAVHPALTGGCAEGEVFAAYPDAEDLVAVRAEGRELALGLAKVYPWTESPEGL